MSASKMPPVNPDKINKPAVPGQWEAVTKAASLIKGAIDENRKIAVWGHDDIDGIASTAILLDALPQGTKYYIPPKSNTHYGLEKGIIDRFWEEGVSLLITVDSGISSFDEAAYASSKGLELIITDHHELPQRLPEAACIVNPKMAGSGRPTPNLSGAGISLYLAASLDEESDDWLSRHPNRTAWAALATVSDRVPMTDENWHIVRQGAEYIDNNSALKRLGESLGISNDRGLSVKIISQNYVGLLSSGISGGYRHETLELLQGMFDPERWSKIYAEEQLWLNRKEDEINTKTSAVMADDNPLKIIVDKQMAWSLVGPVAGGIRDKTGNPVVIIGNKNGSTAGECRGFEPFDFVSMLNELKDYFVQFGGHKPAAGFTILNGRESELIEAMGKYGIRNRELILKSKPSGSAEHRFLRLEQIESVLPEIKAGFPYGPSNQPPVCIVSEMMLPRYCQAGDRYWLKYLLTRQTDTDFSKNWCRFYLDITHKGNFYIDILETKSTN